MKLLSSLRYRFSILTVLTVLLFATANTDVRAQGNTPPYASAIPFANYPYEAYSQMWNANSTTWYYGTIPIDGTSAYQPRMPFAPGHRTNLGVQSDTSAAGGAITLSTSAILGGYVNLDSAVLQPLPTNGSVTFTISIQRTTTVNATVGLVLQSSSDGLVWGTVNATGTATPLFMDTAVTAGASAIILKVSISGRLDRFYRWVATGDGTHGYAAKAWWYWEGIKGNGSQ